MVVACGSRIQHADRLVLQIRDATKVPSHECLPLLRCRGFLQVQEWQPVCSESDGGFSGLCVSHYMWLGFNEQTEVQDIQGKLAEFLPTPEARELTMRIYQLALDVDNEINTL